WGARPAGRQPVPRRASAPHPRPPLPLRVRAARRPERGLVEADADRRVAAAALLRRSAPASLPRHARLARRGRTARLKWARPISVLTWRVQLLIPREFKPMRMTPAEF